ncbi:MAG: hypothetical protein M3O15_12970 [Acidobacteriota bacterium]|nr:hypothetical protein [Acidobacteriota bacterium]
MRLDYVLLAHVADGYLASTDLLTRYDRDSDFASDACVRQAGIDPATGARYLEEMAFEVVSEQNEGLVTEKARRMHRRGVRRIFTVWVKGRPRVREWSPESESWSLLPTEGQIEDRCLVKPLQVKALLDAAIADNAVVQALAAKGNLEILKVKAEGKAEGRIEGKTQGLIEGKAQGLTEGKAQGLVEGKAQGLAEAVLRILETRGVAVGSAERQEILRCSDLEQLSRWLDRATVASSVDEVTSKP